MTMKKILIKLAMLTYIIGSMFILCMAILFPVGYGMKDFPNWTGFIIYPLSLLIMASQEEVLNYFDTKTL